MAIENDAKRALDAGDVAAGAWVLSGSPRVAEVLARTAVDWVGIDTEHAPRSPERVEELVRAVEPHATPIVRLPSVEAAVSAGAKHALDAGARGVIVPRVETAEEAERAVDAARFPPDGRRGLASTTRANEYGDRFDDYVAGANEATLVVLQIESRTAVENAAEILSVGGVDVVLVGENDLSASFGRPGEREHPEVRAAVDRVLDAALEHGVYPGIVARTPAAMADRADCGFRFFLLGADLSFVRAGVEGFLSE